MGEQRRCEKCRGEDITFSYHASSYGDHGCAWGDHTKSGVEHLHYRCHVCGWDWTGPILQVEARNA